MNNKLAIIRKLITFLVVAGIVIASIVFVAQQKSSEWPHQDGNQVVPPGDSHSEKETVRIKSSTDTKLIPDNPKGNETDSPHNNTVTEKSGSPPVPDTPIPVSSPSDPDLISPDSIAEVTDNAEPPAGKGIDNDSFMKLINNNEYKKAEDKLEIILKDDAKNPEANRQMGILLLNRGSIAEAAKYLEKAREGSPGSDHYITELGITYIITDPAKASDYFEKEISGKTIDEKTLEASIEAFMANQAYRRKNDKDIQNKYLRLSSILLNKLHQHRIDKKGYIQDLDLLRGGILYLQGNLKDAGKHFESVGLSPKDPGNVYDKIHASFARGIVYLSRGKLEEADRFITSANKMLKGLEIKGPEKVLPRKEEMIFCETVLFKKGLLFFHLESMMKERKKMIENGVQSFENADRIRELLLKMEKSKIDGNNREALKTADDLLSLIDDSGGFYLDLAMIQPLFKSSLQIYMADIYLSADNKTEAEKLYLKASRDFPPLEYLVKKRMKETGIR